jgi:hypothetical protein
MLLVEFVDGSLELWTYPVVL